jgi:hypothetical protein
MRRSTVLSLSLRLLFLDIFAFNWGAQYIMGENLKVVCAEFSTLSKAVLAV